MFPKDSGTELEVGCLRSGRIFRLGQRRNALLGRGIVLLEKKTTRLCHTLTKFLAMKKKNIN